MLASKEDLSTTISEILSRNWHIWEDDNYFVYLYDGKTDAEVRFSSPL